MRLAWRTDSSRGWNIEVADIGAFVATIVAGGAGTIGTNVFVGSFAGQVIAIQGSFIACEKALVDGARFELLRAANAIPP